MKLILLGPPAAGKGTQAEKIVEKYSLAHISTGDMLRAEIASKTSLGMKAKTIIDNGNLVPDEIINAMVESRIKQDDCKSGFLLDGYPRTIAQAETLDGITKIDAVLDIDVDQEVLIARVAKRRVCPKCKHTQMVENDKQALCQKCGSELIQRPDDNKEAMLHRLEVYCKNTLPLIEYYKKKGILVPVNGSGSIDEVSKEIFKYINETLLR